MSIRTSAPHHPDRVATRRWVTSSLSIATALCLAVAGQHVASGRLQASTGFVVGFVVALLAMFGLTSVSIRLVARVLLLVSAVGLVRLGLISGSITTGGQSMLLWLVAAVFVLVLSDRVGTDTKAPLAPPTSTAGGASSGSGWATARSGAIVAGVVLLVAILAAPVVLPYVGKATEPGEGATLDPYGRDVSVLRSTDSLDMTRRPELTDEVVFTVESDRATFWRGQTFDVWDGRRWTRSDGGFVPLASYDTPQLGADDLSANGSDVVEQRFRIEAPYSDVVFAVPTAVQVDIDRPLRQRADGTLYSAPLGRGAAYSVTSRRIALTDERLRSVEGAIPAEVGAQYAQPPKTTDRVRAAATEITAGATTTYDKVLALEQWMGERVEYSLDAPLAPTDVDVVDHFLFEAEQGWCEQIASSLVVLARANGIPARLVTGYVPGDHDPVTGRFTVRQRDAHAWAEVWFPEVGWVPFDPTADVPLAGADQSEPTFTEWLQQHVVVVVLGVAAVVLLVGPVRLAVRRLRARRRSRPVGWTATADRRLDQLGARVGRPRADHETASAYAEALAERYRDRRLVDAGTLIDQSIYGARPPSPEREADIDALLAGLATAEVPAEPELVPVPTG